MQASELHLISDWQRSARTVLVDDLSQVQFQLTGKALVGNIKDIEVWVEKHKDFIRQAHLIFDNIKNTDLLDLGILSYAVRQLERLAINI